MGGTAESRYARDLLELKEGSRPAMERLLLDARALTYRFSVMVCGNLDDAQDAMQEAMLQTYRHASQIREPAAFRTWLYRTVKNACLMSRRPHVGTPPRLVRLDEPGAPDLPTPAPTPEDLAAESDDRRRFRDALRRLPKPYRLVIFLRDVEELPAHDVAQIVGISEDNVKQRLHRARQMLRAALSDAHGSSRL